MHQRTPQSTRQRSRYVKSQCSTWHILDRGDISDCSPLADRYAVCSPTALLFHLSRSVLRLTNWYRKVSEPAPTRNWHHPLRAKWRPQYMVNVWQTYSIQRSEEDVRMVKMQLYILTLINVNSLYPPLKNASKQHPLNLKWLTILSRLNINPQRTTGCLASTGRRQEVLLSTSHK